LIFYQKSNQAMRVIPIDGGTRGVVEDAFRIIFDKDRILAKLVDAFMS
jgi:hypothetical protein